MVQKLKALSRSPSGARTAATTKSAKGSSSRQSRSERGLGRDASPHARPEARRTGQQRRARPSWVEEPVPPPDVNCRTSSTPPTAAPRLPGAVMPPRLPHRVPAVPAVAARRAPPQPLQFSDTNVPFEQQLPGPRRAAWTAALVCPRADQGEPGEAMSPDLRPLGPADDARVELDKLLRTPHKDGARRITASCLRRHPAQQAANYHRS